MKNKQITKSDSDGAEYNRLKLSTLNPFRVHQSYTRFAPGVIHIKPHSWLKD
jgi:hypothetical protein